MPIDLQLGETDDGVTLPLRARPRARQNAVTGSHDGALSVSVTEAPEKGKANDAIIKALAEALDLRRSQLKLIAGASSHRKRVLVQGVTLPELQQRIANVLDALGGK